MIEIKRINCELSKDNCNSCGHRKRLMNVIMTFPSSARGKMYHDFAKCTTRTVLCNECLERLQRKIEKIRTGKCRTKPPSAAESEDKPNE